MSRKQRKHTMARVWSAVAIMAIWLAGAAGGFAADAPAATSANAPTQTVGKLTLNGAGAYQGEIRDGKANGKGTLTFDDGRKYVGEFRDNRRYGQGSLTIGGFKYEGGWQDDSYHGQGTETYPNGLKYVGVTAYARRSRRPLRASSSGTSLTKAPGTLRPTGSTVPLRVPCRGNRGSMAVARWAAGRA